jgi:hypothetical protein
MGVFDRVLTEHKANQQAQADAAERAKQEAQSAAQAFATSFRNAVETKAKPAFEAFAKEAIAAGFDARITDENEHGLPSVALSFTCHPSAILNAGSTHQCTYRLGMTPDLKVSHQRRGDSSMEPFPVDRLALASISKEVIERELGELLARALKAARV